MSKIDEVLEFLASRQDSYTLDEISRSILISHYVCERIVHFLVKYGFVHSDDIRVRINPKMRDFVIETSGKTLLQQAHSMTSK